MLTVLLGVVCFFFFQAEDGILDAQESRGLGDVYKRQTGMVAGARVSWLMMRKTSLTGCPVASASVQPVSLSLIHI